MNNIYQLLPVCREVRGPSPGVHPQLGVSMEGEVGDEVRQCVDLVPHHLHLNLGEGSWSTVDVRAGVV